MSHKQITQVERYLISHYRKQGLSQAEIARAMGRHPSTISREVRRNQHTPGNYVARIAQAHGNGRRSRTRKVSQFNEEQWSVVHKYLREDWSPEQISLKLREWALLEISHETIYRHVWADKRVGGSLFMHLRQSQKRRRKRYKSHDSRGMLQGKRTLAERPEAANDRTETGHCEADLVHGAAGSRQCILTVVDRKSRLVTIIKLMDKSMKEVNRALIKVIRKLGILTVTLDNGSEYHDYKRIERLTGVKFYFAAPYHSWERGTSENTNGLIRQYLPKKASMAKIDQWMCNAIAKKLNRRPRKTLNLRTPEQAHIQDFAGGA
jgi:transposase, IS30 family